MNDISESQWVIVAHTAEFRPPMPWFTLHDMTEQDLRAIYRFVKHLGPSGGPVPSYLPPESRAHRALRFVSSASQMIIWLRANQALHSDAPGSARR